MGNEMVPRGAEAYLDALQQLLPRGCAWRQAFERSELRMTTATGSSSGQSTQLLSPSVSPPSRATAGATRAVGSRLWRLLHASADELARVDAAARLLVDEINPLTTVNGLEDWERVLGLPDACLPAGDTLQERRGAVLAKLRDEGRQDLAWWYEVAESLGYDVAIEEHWPFLCGVHECFDPSNLTECEIQAHHEIGFLGEPNVRLWWNVVVYGERLLLFRCGESLCPERLLDWREATDLECIMQRDKLAHTVLTFDYRQE